MLTKGEERERELLQKVHRVESSNTQKYLKVFRKECEQKPFWRFEFVSEISGGITPLNISKEDGG